MWMRSAAVMLLIALAWNADVEALPIHQDTGGADLGTPIHASFLRVLTSLMRWCRCTRRPSGEGRYVDGKVGSGT